MEISLFDFFSFTSVQVQNFVNNKKEDKIQTGIFKFAIKMIYKKVHEY